jgi:hypothetical protein
MLFDEGFVIVVFSLWMTQFWMEAHYILNDGLRQKTIICTICLDGMFHEFSLDTTDGLPAWPPSLQCLAGSLQTYFLKVLGLTWFILANSAFEGALGISLMRNYSLMAFTMLDSTAAWLVLFWGGGAKTTVVGELDKSVVDGFAFLVGCPRCQYAVHADFDHAWVSSS